ncbi:hypothetical protein CRG98_034776 [Punica granatum]|uniref:Uncharacterized protein n=1 Tax=Punica granatum TaxID=22663 RepID=A0A2I0ILE4_PUNGR|nr:hypothetical protein CRG98_034776 [Punica granatum]
MPQLLPPWGGDLRSQRVPSGAPAGEVGKQKSSSPARPLMRSSGGTAYQLPQRKCFGEYNLRPNDYEHFAIFCRTGQKQQEQMSFFNDLESGSRDVINDYADAAIGGFLTQSNRLHESPTKPPNYSISWTH